MTIQQLQYLVAIAQCNSISQAAKRLFVSQSNISKAVKHLERELGFSILERKPRGVSFTSRGLDFLKDTYALTEHFDSFTARYTNSDQERMNFSVSSQHYIFVLAAVVQILQRAGSQSYSISLREGKTSEIIDDVLSRRSQIGFIFYNDTVGDVILRELERYNLVFHPFCKARPHVYLSKKHPLAEEKILSLEQLESYPYVCYDQGADSAHFMEEILSPSHPQQMIYVSDRCSMLKIISNSTAYTTGTGYLYNTYIDKDIITIPIKGQAGSTQQICWIVPNGQPVSQELQDFVQLCKQIQEDCHTGNVPQPFTGFLPRKAGASMDYDWASAHLP